MFERLKVWFSLPFAMPGPISLDWPAWYGWLAGMVGLMFIGSPLRWRLPRLMPHRDRLLFAIFNFLSNSSIPFLRCEILFKLNKVFEHPQRWRSHIHLGELARHGHFDWLVMNDDCIQEACFSQRQLTWLNRFPASLKEIYRQRMLASISTGDRLQFGHRQWSGPDRYMTEEGPGGLGKLVLNEGR